MHTKSKSKFTLTLLLLVSASALTGCVSQLSSKFTDNGLPAERYLVGGGYSIKYVAPADGTVYWVEQTTEKILETRSVFEGDEVHFGSEYMDPESVQQVLGIDLKDARFMLYFIPNR